MPLYEYDSNNSGGYWWLKDEDWKKLEEAGWTVMWGGHYFCTGGWGTTQPPEGAPRCTATTCPGHRKYRSYVEAVAAGPGGRYMGALAVSAQKEFPSEKMAIAEFEHVAGQDFSDDGCSCCGEPHSMSDTPYHNANDLQREQPLDPAMRTGYTSEAP